MQEICRFDWRRLKERECGKFKEFTTICPRNIPAQKGVRFSFSFSYIFIDKPLHQNGTECGVFLLFYAYCIAGDFCMDFTLKDCARFRQKILVEILQGEISQNQFF